MARTFLKVAAVIATVAGLAGCATHHAPASMGMVSPQGDVLSLGAGDSLGRAVYVNDLILAAAAMQHDVTFTRVEEHDTRWEFEPRD